MLETIFFVVGFILGAASSWVFYSKIHGSLKGLDEKYERLIGVISEWQKKT